MPTLRLLNAIALAFLGMSAMTGCQAFRNGGDVIRVQAPQAFFSDAQQATRTGVAAAERGDMAAAEASFQQAVAADEAHGPAHNNLGRIYFDRGDLRRAAQAFGWAVEFMPGRPEPLNNLGLIFEKVGKLEKAIDFYQQAHMTTPGEPEYLANLLRARIRKGDRPSEIKSELQNLKFLETRPEWKVWVDQQLVSATANDRANLFSSESDSALQSRDMKPESLPPIELSGPLSEIELLAPANTAEILPLPDSAKAKPPIDNSAIQTTRF